MKSMVVTSYNEVLTIADLPIPECKPDEVLVKVYTHRTNDVSDFDFKLALQMDMIAKEKHGAIEPSYGLDKLLK